MFHKSHKSQMFLMFHKSHIRGGAPEKNTYDDSDFQTLSQQKTQDLKSLGFTTNNLNLIVHVYHHRPIVGDILGERFSFTCINVVNIRFKTEFTILI